jgi:acetyl esterase/lipase
MRTMSWFKKLLYAVTLPLGALFFSSGGLAADSPWQKSFGEVEALKFREADRRIPYGDEASQFIDLWLPRGKATESRPVVVLIHGGCWLEQYAISHVRPLATALADRGFAVWAVEYRRVGEAGGGWPGTFQDISAAVDRLKEFGHPAMQKRRAVFIGHSAGGHLALWAAGRSRLEQGRELYREDPFVPVGAVGLAAITDLKEYAGGDSSCQRVAPQLMGGTPAQFPGRYDQASPAVLGADVPVVLLQGGADGIVPPAQAQAFAGAEVILLEEAGHFDLIHTRTPAFPKLVEVLKELFAQ